MLLPMEWILKTASLGRGSEVCLKKKITRLKFYVTDRDRFLRCYLHPFSVPRTGHGRLGNLQSREAHLGGPGSPRASPGEGFTLDPNSAGERKCKWAGQKKQNMEALSTAAHSPGKKSSLKRILLISPQTQGLACVRKILYH